MDPNFPELSHLDALDQQIERAVARFSKGVKVSAPQIFGKLSDLVSRLDKTGTGTIPKKELLNVKVINQMRREIKAAINSSDYPEAVTDFLKEFESIKNPINRYFSEVVGKFGTSKTYAELQAVYMEATADALIGTGLEAAFERPIFRIIQEGVIQGVPSSKLKENLKRYVLEDQNYGSDAKTLNTYAGQISDDAINQYSRNYIEANTADLGLKHYFFKGTIIRTTRTFCDRRVGRYFTEAEVLAWGDLAEKTQALGRPAWPGVYKGTNKTNIKTLLGGYRCRHRLAPVTEDLYNLRTENGTKNVFNPDAALEARKIPESASKARAKAKAKEKVKEKPATTEKVAPAPAKPAKTSKAKAPEIADPRVKFRPAGMDPETYGAEIAPDFWAKLQTAVKPDFTPSGNGFCSPGGKDRLTLVNVPKGSERWIKSDWYKKSIVYHEYGHALHFTSDLIPWERSKSVDPVFADLFSKAKKSVIGKKGDALYSEFQEFTSAWRSKVAIKPRLKELVDKLGGFDAITPEDFAEMRGAYADTLAALTRGRIGWGHKNAYWKQFRAPEMEVFAHAMENGFLGNPVFEALNPDLYNLMRQYALNIK